MQVRLGDGACLRLLLYLGVGLCACAAGRPACSRLKVCLPCCKGWGGACFPPVKRRSRAALTPAPCALGCPVPALRAGRGVLPARKRRKTEGLDPVKGFVRAPRKGGEAK